MRSPFTRLAIVPLILILACSLLFSMSARALVDQEKPAPETIRWKWIGDYDEMVKSRHIRILVPYSKTFYFLDGADQKGLTYDLLQEFEKFINKREKTGTIKIRVLVIPTLRNRLFQDLRDGIGDIAAGNLTITTERSKLVDFADPLAVNIDEIVATAADQTGMKNVFDLSGRKVFVRKSSSYYESLQQLNNGLREMGRKPVDIHKTPTNILKMKTCWK